MPGSHEGYVGISVVAPGDEIHFIGQENRIIIIFHLNGVSRNVMLCLIVVCYTHKKGYLQGIRGKLEDGKNILKTN